MHLQLQGRASQWRTMRSLCFSSESVSTQRSSLLNNSGVPLVALRTAAGMSEPHTVFCRHHDGGRRASNYSSRGGTKVRCRCCNDTSALWYGVVYAQTSENLLKGSTGVSFLKICWLHHLKNLAVPKLITFTPKSKTLITLISPQSFY